VGQRSGFSSCSFHSMIRPLAKRLLAALPAPLDLMCSNWARWLGSSAHRDRARITARAVRELGVRDVVRSGPFATMAYPVASGAQGGLVPKLAGTYEKELASEIERIIADDPTLVIDIGAADGYYAAGMAWRLPGARVIAYEMEKPLRGVVERVCRANGVAHRVDVRGECTIPRLRDDLRRADDEGLLGRTVVIADIEGYEDILLDPANVPELRHATVLCEVHELLRPGVGERLTRRFRGTHDISVTASRPRTSADVPDGLSIARPEEALDEGRTSQMHWFTMRPSASATAIAGSARAASPGAS
jgi:hypothetical protein